MPSSLTPFETPWGRRRAAYEAALEDVSAASAASGLQVAVLSADVILLDARARETMAADLAEIDTWASLPAVKAGQVYDWYAAAPYSYRTYAKIYQEIADELKAADDL